MAQEFEVLIGINYEDKRAEPGDIITDLPTAAISDLLALNAIRKAEKPKAKTPVEKEE